MERNEGQDFDREIGTADTTSGQTGFDGQTTTSRDTGFDDASSSTGVKGKVKSVASSVKDKASNLPAMLADGLQAGAEALRQRRTSIAGVSGPSGTVVAEDSSLAAVTDTLASGMQSSAEWLRDADLDKIKDGVEKQVKEHPARTLLIALGAGYILGKAFRR
jgi:hypothetical protein